MLQREPTANVVRDVIEKDEPERDSPACIQAKIALERLIRSAYPELQAQGTTLRVE
jgi:hypothetical protein